MRNYRRNTIRLTERDLAKLIKKMINEGEASDTYKNAAGRRLETFCASDLDGSTITIGGVATDMTSEQFSELCASLG